MKRLIVYFLFFPFLVFSGLLRAQNGNTYSVKKVVIDPGHGGRDPGAVSGNFKEKDIVLAIGLRLGELINQNLPDVEVIYTRKTDVFIPLYERGNIANRNKADLFISIHADAARSTSASGSSTFVMGLDKADRNLDVAMRENDVITYESDYSRNYQGYVPGDTESYIIFSLMQYAYLDQSMNLASGIQRHYQAVTPYGDRGARQGPYLVLWTPAMPSVLTEVGFITNPNDRRFITSKDGQEKIARALFNAFSEYKSKTEGNSRIVVLDGAELPASASVASRSATAGGQSEIRPASAQSGTIFEIQVSASTSRLEKTRARFGTYANQVTEKKIGNYYKYYVGSTDSYREALSLQREIRKRFKDAFIVAFRDGEPVTITDDMKRN